MGDIHEAIKYVAVVRFTLVFVLIFTMTFFPKGALFNPKMLYGEKLEKDLENAKMSGLLTVNAI